MQYQLAGESVEVEASDVVALRSEVVLVDVRSPAEFEAGHAPGAIPVTLSDLERGWSGVDARLPYVVCRGGEEAAQAAAALRRSGRDAFAVRGGMRAWMARHCPLVTNIGRAPAVL